MNLRSCPLCGGVLRKGLEPFDRSYDCTECDTTIYVGYKNPQCFINSRPIEDVQAKRIEELERIVKRFIYRAENECGVEDFYESLSYLIDELAEAKRVLEVKQ